MEKQTYFITFDNASAEEANRYAEELRHLILEASPDVTIQRQRDDPHSQDFGATLVLLLGTPAAVAIIKAIGDWLALRNRASLSIRRDGEALALQNITSAKAVELAQLLFTREQSAGMEVQTSSSALAPSPQNTLLILLGASAWPFFPEFQSSEAFARAAQNVKNYFLNPRLFGLPAENLLDLFDVDETADKLDLTIGEFLEQRLATLRATDNAGRDVLLYFIGHGGFIGRDSDFYLAIRRTRMDSPRASGMQMMALADTLTQRTRQMRRFLILDCCFAGAAFSAFQAGAAQVALQKTNDAFEVKRKAVGFPTRGTTLLCSSSHKSPSLLLPDGSSTMFTRAILDALIQETPAGKSPLSLRDVKDIAANLLSEIHNAPRPVVLSPDQSEGDVADIPFFPNPGLTEEERREEEKRYTSETKQASLAEGKRLLGADEQIGTHQHKEKRTQEVKKDAAHISAFEAATIQPVRLGQHSLSTIILGFFLSLVNMLFLHLIPIWAGVDPYPTPLQAFPFLVVPLIAGVTLGKSREALPVSLLAGLLMNISGFVFMLVKYSFNGVLPSFPQEAWVLLTFVTVAGGPLCWLVAWMRIHTHPYER